jgi:hypothetical protein
LNKCRNRYSRFDNISDSIPSEYVKDPTPARGLQLDLAGEFICENVGVNKVLLLFRFKEFQ